MCCGSVRTCFCPASGCWVPMNLGSLPFWWRVCRIRGVCFCCWCGLFQIIVGRVLHFDFGGGLELFPMDVGSVPHWVGQFLLLVRGCSQLFWQCAKVSFWGWSSVVSWMLGVWECAAGGGSLSVVGWGGLELFPSGCWECAALGGRFCKTRGKVNI